jgi:hypothetical protein
MYWFNREPTLAEMLSDPIVQALMRADGVTPREIEALLRRLGTCPRAGGASTRPGGRPAPAPYADRTAAERI